jgi:hypothetical protein
VDESRELGQLVVEPVGLLEMRYVTDAFVRRDFRGWADGEDVLGRRRQDDSVGLALGHEEGHLELVARGCTNREIAATLVISVKTASVHVSHILQKLGAPNRHEAAAIARRVAAPPRRETLGPARDEILTAQTGARGP